MQMPVKKWFTFIEETAAPAGEAPQRKVAIVAVVANPYAGRQVEDLQPMIDASVELGRLMAERGVQAMAPFKIMGLGKGGVAGMAGEQEHVNALLTTAFAVPIPRGDRRRQGVDLLDDQARWPGHFDRHPVQPQGRAVCALVLRRHLADAA